MKSIVDLIAKGAFEQCLNKRNNRVIDFDGKSLSLGEMAKEFGINRTTLAQRLNAGWSIRDALTRSVRAKGGVA